MAGYLKSFPLPTLASCSIWLLLHVNTLNIDLKKYPLVAHFLSIYSILQCAIGAGEWAILVVNFLYQHDWALGCPWLNMISEYVCEGIDEINI